MILKRETSQVIEDPDSPESTKAWLHRWPVWCFAIWCIVGGLAFDWYCAYEWFAGKHTYFSIPVLGVMGLIVLVCISISIIVVLLTKEKWIVVVIVFAVASCSLCRVLLSWWGAHR